MPSPVTPEEFQATIPDSTASKCAAFTKALLRLPVLLWKLVSWLLDEDGNPSAAFKRAIQPTGTFEFAAVELDEDGSRLLCNGAAVSRETYADLYLVIADAYGNGDGSTTFNLPDFRDRFPIGQSATKLGTTTGGTSEHIVEEENIQQIAVKPAATGVSASVWTSAFASGDSVAGRGVGQGGPVTGPTFQALIGEATPTPINHLPPYVAVWIYIRT